MPGSHTAVNKFRNQVQQLSSDNDGVSSFVNLTPCAGDGMINSMNIKND